MNPAIPAIPAIPATPAVLAALGDETRWSILVRVGRSPASASALAAELPLSRQAIARHLALLRAAGLVETQREGRELRYLALGARLSALGGELETIAAGWDRTLAAIRAEAEGRG